MTTRRPRIRCGFTLVELLVAAAIIVLLVAISVIGMKKLTDHGRRRATEQALANVRGMFTEYERATLLRPLEGARAGGATGSYFYAEPRVPGQPVVYAQRAASATPIGAGETDGTRYLRFWATEAQRAAKTPEFEDEAFRVARLVMTLVTAIPANSNALAVLPAEQVNRVAPEGPLVLDAWMRPIIFVPPGGLASVKVGNSTTTVKSPDGRPFFASAGPDGIFATGTDNVYSFER